MSSTDLVINIIGNAKSAIDALDEFGNKAKESESKWSSAKTGITLASAAVVASVGAFAKGSIDAYSEAEDQQAQLERAYQKFPGVANVSIDALRALNTEVQAKTGYDDDALAASQASLAQFGLTGSQIKQLTPLMADYAAKTGKDLPNAADDLGKAMLGQGKALKAIGVNFKDAGSSGANFEQLVTGLDGTVGGFADTMGETASGKAKILATEFENIQETVGQMLMPALKGLTDVGVKVTKWMSDNPAIVQAAAIAIGILTAAVIAMNIAIWAQNVALLASPITWIVLAVVALIAAVVLLAMNWSAVTQWITTVWAGFIGWITGVMNGFVGWWNGLWSAVGQWISDVWNGFIGWIVAVWNGFIGWIMGVLNLYVAGWVAIWNFVAGFVSAVWTGIVNWIVAVWNGFMAFFVAALSAYVGFWVGVWNGILNVVSSIWNSIVNAVRGAIGWVGDAVNNGLNLVSNVWSNVWNGLGGVVRGVWNGILGFIESGVNGAIDLINGMISAVNNVAGAVGIHIGLIGHVGLPRLATGTVTSGPMIAMIGDNPGGREVVAPYDSYVDEIRRAAGVGQASTAAANNGPQRLARDDLDYLARRIGELIVDGITRGSTKAVFDSL